MLLKVHPDKGGKKEDTQNLQAAKEEWEKARKKRRPLGKLAYTMRVKSVIKSQKAQTVAKNFAGRLRKACQQVIKRKGAAANN